MLRGLKSLSYTKCENLVRDVTADSDSPPKAEQMAQLATFTLTGTKEQYTKILAMLSKRMTDYPKIKHVTKSLIVIDYGLTNFSDKFVSDIAQQQSVIQRITKYRYYKNGETDIAGPVRELAASILLKLSDDIEEERQNAPGHKATAKAPPNQQEEEEVEAAEERQPEAAEEREPEAAEEREPEAAATEAENNAVKFDGWDDGSIEVQGRVGINEGRVNGVYKPRAEEHNVGGRTSFVKEAQMEDPIVMWFWEKNKGLWMISRESGIGSDQAYACTQTGLDAQSPLDIPAGQKWMVYNPNLGDGKGGYEKDSKITVSAA